MPVVGKVKSKNCRYPASLYDYPSKLKHKACLQPRTADHGPGLLEPFPNQIWTLLKGVGPQDVINAFLRQYKQIRCHHALDMRSPVPEAVLEKAKISGA
jgi:hypothetical protein